MKKFLVIIISLTILGLWLVNDAFSQTYGGATVPYGTATPGTCANIGDLFWDSDDDLLYICDPVDTWTAAGGGTNSITDSDFSVNGLMERNGSGSYGTATEGIDYYKPGGTSVAFGDLASLDKMDLTTLTSAPTTPEVGRLYLADGITWDPAGLGIGKEYYVMSALDTTELINPSDNSNFTGGATDWANRSTALSVFLETDDLSITADGIGDFCELPETYAPTEINKWYRVTFDLDTLVGTWTLKDFDGVQTYGQITAAGTGQSIEFQATYTGGGFQIVADTATASGNFDNFQLNEIVYVAMWDRDGIFYVASIATPTLESDELNDQTGSTYDLTTTELKNKIHSNKGATVARVYQMPARTEGWNVIFVIENGTYGIDILPYSGEQYYLNGVQMAATEPIVNDAPTVGESVACFSTESDVFCETKYPDFAQETP